MKEQEIHHRKGGCTMTKIQPQDEIGPNNAGKMIIRGICFSSAIEDYPELKAQVDDYMSARGTAGPIKLSRTVSLVEFNPDEAAFLSSLIEKLRKLEFTPEQLPTVTALDTKKQSDAMVKLVEDEIAGFLEAQEKKGLRVCFTGVSDTIIENVKSRRAVSYAATQKWEDNIEVIEQTFDMFAGMTLHNQGGNTYTPPTIEPMSHSSSEKRETIDGDDRPHRSDLSGVGFQSMFFKSDDADKTRKAIESMLDDEEDEHEATHSDTPSSPGGKK